MLKKLLLSIGVSIGLLALLFHFALSSAEPKVWSSLVAILTAFSWGYGLLYLCISLIRTLLQAIRYRLLLKVAETDVPSLYHVYVVTLSRNMFVDMLPARLGELSYIAMLNRGYRVSGESCVSSLVIAFVFDLIALAILILTLLIVQLLGGEYMSWMAGVLVMLSLVIGTALILLYPAFKLFNSLVYKIAWLQRGIPGKGLEFLKKVETALDETRRAGIVGKTLLISLGVRVTKYLALYSLFLGVAATQFPELSTAIATVLPALVSAEAGASLPVPAFMGFGTYEAAGTLALVALGVSSATSLIVMLALHVISQIFDYLLGALGVVAFIFRTSQIARIKEKSGPLPWKVWAALLALCAAATLFLAYEMRAVKKRGSLKAPQQGQAIAPTPGQYKDALKKLDGFLVWSSNRSGNHDIWLRSFPDNTVRRVTSHPHAEYYARISPDGKRIVFARAHEPWVPQRNVYAWDVILLNIESGEERLLAKNGNVPTWSANGKLVYFQRNANQLVEINIRTGRERVLFQSGANIDVPPKTELQTPSVSGKGRLAVTFRKTFRATSVVDKDGTIRKTGNGCQLNWGPGDRYLVKIDHGGRKQNAIYKIDSATLEAKKWFDAPGDYSHEYFPKVANTRDVLVYGASASGHEHDSADYEIFLWVVGAPEESVARITFHTGNDCWPDIFLNRALR